MSIEKAAKELREVIHDDVAPYIAIVKKAQALLDALDAAKPFTQEQIIHAYAQAYCVFPNTGKVMDADIGLAMAKILFSPEESET